MFTAQLVAALIAAGVATAKAIAKGVQAKRQREAREKQQEKHLSAMEQASEQMSQYRGEYKQEAMEGLQHQQEQMQPLFDIMSQMGASAGYQAPDMSWLMDPPQSRSNVGPKVRTVKAKEPKAEPVKPAPWSGAAGRGEDKRFGA